MNNQDWTPEEDEAFNAVEKQSNLGKQILRDIEGQPYVYAPKREWVGLTYEDMVGLQKELFDKKGEMVLPTTFAMAVEAKLKEKNT
jgi:hypothetical protein